MRYLFILLLITSTAYGQTLVPFGGTRPTDTAYAARSLRIDSVVRLARYGSTDTNKVIGVDAGGRLVLRTKGTATTDSNVFATVARLYKVSDSVANEIPTDYVTQSALNDSASAIRAITKWYFPSGHNAISYSTNDIVELGNNYKITIDGDDGSYIFNQLNGAGAAVATFGSGGQLSRFDFDGNSSSYLAGNGMWQTLPSYATTAALADSVSGRQKYSDTSTFDATRSWVSSGYVPYTGATDSVRLGEYPIRAGQFNLDLTPTAPTVIGGMYWDATHVCPAMPFNATYTHRFGEALVTRGRNNTGTTISAGKAVYISGAQGNNPTITMANPDSVNSSRVIGVTVESIANNGTGFVMVTGYLDGINTSGYTVGASLYLDTTTGGLTQALLPSPHNVVYVGQALNSTNNGRIFIRPSQALGSDTTLGNASEQIAPTQEAVKKYVTTSISGKQNFTDTTTWDATKANLNTSVATRQLYTDTSTFDATRAWVNGRGFGTGTVTSVGSGFGLSGGAITTTGTLRVDSTNVPTQYRVDTAAANALARINTKGSGTVTSIQVVGGTGATVTPTTAVTTSGVYTVTPEVSSATFNTLTNKRITYRTGGAASYTTSVTIASDSVDMFVITAQAGALLFNAPSGTPTQGQMLLIRIKDNGTARALTWNAIWRSGTDVTLPSTTVLSKTLYMEFLYNTTDSKWDIVGKADGY
jgi:hypothetical protein